MHTSTRQTRALGNGRTRSVLLTLHAHGWTPTCPRCAGSSGRLTGGSSLRAATTTWCVCGTKAAPRPGERVLTATRAHRIPACAHARGGARATRAALSFSFVGAAALLCTQRQRRFDRRIHRSRNACLQTCLPVCRLSLAFHTAAVKALAWAPLKVRKQHWSQKSVADMCWLAKTPFKGTDNAKKGASSCAYGICACWRSPG